MQVVVDTLLTNYERKGSGKQVLILPGWADTVASWRVLADELAKTYDVTVLDLPGFGGSQAPETAWGLDEYAEFVQAFMAKLNLALYTLIGHSNGGAIVVRGLELGLFKADKLVLLASAGIRGEAAARKGALRVVAKTGKVLTWPLPHSLKQRLRRQLYRTAGSDLLVAEHMQASFKKIVADDIRKSAAQLTTPTLLVYGDNDEQTPPRYGESLHNVIADSKLQIIAGAGHFLQVDQPAVVLTCVEDFLR